MIRLFFSASYLVESGVQTCPYLVVGHALALTSWKQRHFKLQGISEKIKLWLFKITIGLVLFRQSITIDRPWPSETYHPQTVLDHHGTKWLIKSSGTAKQSKSSFHFKYNFLPPMGPELTYNVSNCGPKMSWWSKNPAILRNYGIRWSKIWKVLP